MFKQILLFTVIVFSGMVSAECLKVPGYAPVCGYKCEHFPGYYPLCTTAPGQSIYKFPGYYPVVGRNCVKYPGYLPVCEQ